MDSLSLLDRDFRSVGWNGVVHSRRRERNRCAYGHGTMDGRSTGGVGGGGLQVGDAPAVRHQPGHAPANAGSFILAGVSAVGPD